MSLISGAALSAGDSPGNNGERAAQMRQACDLLAALEALRGRLVVLKRRVGS